MEDYESYKQRRIRWMDIAAEVCRVLDDKGVEDDLELECVWEEVKNMWSET